MTKKDYHLHSNFSDGNNSPEEMLKAAIGLGYKEIAFTDHVRRDSEWVEKYIEELKKLKNKYKLKIKILIGVEAKVINLQGELDLPPKISDRMDLILGAFHQIPKGKEQYFSENEILKNKKEVLGFWYSSMKNLLKNPRVNIIAHPTYPLDKYFIFLDRKQKENIARIAKKQNKIFEINFKYNCPDKEFISILKKRGVKIIRSSDSHSIKELRSFSKIYEKTKIIKN